MAIALESDRRGPPNREAGSQRPVEQDLAAKGQFDRRGPRRGPYGAQEAPLPLPELNVTLVPEERESSRWRVR
jgi:hypothetical protein